MTTANPNMVRLDRPGQRDPIERVLEPDAAARDELAAALDLSGLRKLRFIATLTPVGGRDWRLDGTLGATVTQPCAVTLAPVVTRIDETVERLYSARAETPDPGTEIEMPEDDRVEPLPAAVDLAEVMAEALALALPLHPRAEGVDDQAPVLAAPPGAEPLTDAAVHPFAELAKLKAEKDE